MVKRIVLIVGGVLLALVLLIGGWLALDVVQGQQRVQQLSNVTYTGPDGGQRFGYLAQPNTPGPHPVVIVGHEWWGLTEDVTEKADLLAAEGYLAFVPNLWGANSTAFIPRSIFLVATSDQSALTREMQAAWEYLLSQPSADATRTAAIGFCFGGRQVLWLGTAVTGLDAIVQFYGGTIDDPADFGNLRTNGPLLGIFGEDDSILPTTEVRAFEALLQSEGLAHTFYYYAGVGHGFANEMDAISQPGPAQDAWQVTLDFLAEQLN